MSGACGIWSYEWDFRASSGSNIDSSLVAMEVASGGAEVASGEAGPGEETA
jgi:hypothetical protein